MTRAAIASALTLLALGSIQPRLAIAQLDLGGDGEQSVAKVEILGNLAYTDGTLKSLIRTRATSFFRPWRSAPLRSDFLRFDRLVLRDFYRRHGFLGADVESVAIVNRDKSSVEVRFHISEGPHARVDAIDFDGPTASDEEVIRSVIPLSAGGLFDFPAVEVSRLAIDSIYAERGHVAAFVQDSIEVTGENVRVRFTIDPGPQARLRRIDVEGTRSTKPDFVSREVVLKPGAVLARSRLLRSQQRIYDSGLYGDVQFSTGEIDSAARETNLIVSVRERRLGWVDAGVGYGTGTAQQVRLTGQMGQRNLFRDGVRFLATARVGIRIKPKPQFPYVKDLLLGDRRGDVSLTRDWLFGYRVQGSIGAYAEDVPILVTETENPLQAVGATGGFRYELSRWTSLSLLYEARRVNSDSTQLVEDVGTPLKKYTKNSVLATLQRDTRLDLFDPRAGSVATANAEFVGGLFRGNSQFLKVTGTATTYRPWRRRLTIALRARGGLITSGSQGPADTLDLTDLDLIPKDDRFRTGGATTVRGYQENEIGTIVAEDSLGTLVDVPRGGAYLLLVNAEIRARLTGLLGAAAFLDGGGVWEQASDLSWRRIFSISHGAGYKDMRWVAGVGVRFASPVGPVRLDYGWKLRIARSDEPDAVTGRGGFAFSLGQAY
ncbi:MAG: BamA/TamA family outer membrane protein [Candidatus Eisenbacteria bacterium]